MSKAKPSSSTEVWEDGNVQITVDFSQIPDHICDELVEPIIPLITSFYSAPENMEKFENWLESKQISQKKCKDVSAWAPLRQGSRVRLVKEAFQL